MRAAVFSRNSKEGVTVTSNRPDPRIDFAKNKAGNVLVRTVACGVNPVDQKFLIGDKLPLVYDEKTKKSPE